MFQTILLPVDLSDESSWRHALPMAISLCALYEARLFVITVVPDLNLPAACHVMSADDEISIHEQVAAKLKAFIHDRITPAIDTQRVVASGKVYQQILGHAARLKADLIVMGAHDGEITGYQLGSNTARVVRHARCAVMVARDWTD
jgi:nucleotide-binding universal stress UspA family protein